MPSDGLASRTVDPYLRFGPVALPGSVASSVRKVPFNRRKVSVSVIVTGAAGHLGRLVAEQLLERLAPEDLVLVTRRPEALRQLRARGADVRYGDFDDPASLRDAFAGGDRMLLISTDAFGRRVRQHRAAIDAAATAGVGHVVFTSNVNPVAGNPVGANAWEQGRTEAMLKRSGPAWTVLRFGSFAELVLPPAATAVQNGRLITNSGDGRIVPVSRRDCAEAAAITLTTDGHTGKTYEITGPQALSPSDLAELYADLSGRPVKVLQLSDTTLIWVLAGIGTPMPIARSLTAFGRAVRQGYFDVVDPAFERLARRPPVTLRDVLIAQRADLLAGPAEPPKRPQRRPSRGSADRRSHPSRRPRPARNGPGSATG
jgi:NAD(P)H dehydrogenase (quinone)